MEVVPVPVDRVLAGRAGRDPHDHPAGRAADPGPNAAVHRRVNGFLQLPALRAALERTVSTDVTHAGYNNQDAARSAWGHHRSSTVLRTSSPMEWRLARPPRLRDALVCLK
jgi:hypothetical protein